MSRDVEVVELVRPMSAGAFEREIAKRQRERQGEIDGLKEQIAGMDEDELERSDLPARLEALSSTNGTDVAKEIMADNTIKIALRSISRRQAYSRGNMQNEAKDWLVNAVGAEDFSAINIREVPEEVGEVWTAMYQAADIVPAIIPEKCDGWEIPSTLEGWADVPDWIFQRLLAETWALNPQMILGQLSGEA